MDYKSSHAGIPHKGYDNPDSNDITWIYHKIEIYLVAIGLVFFAIWSRIPVRRREKIEKRFSEFFRDPRVFEPPTGYTPLNVSPAGAPSGHVALTVEPQPVAGGAKPRLYYLDNLKAFLTALVVAHHCALSYHGAGDLYAVLECPGHVAERDMRTFARTGSSADLMRDCTNYFNQVIGPFFTETNQSYFMTFFFFVSAYFTPGSLHRKGTFQFLQDRFIRLGIPALVWYFVLGESIDLWWKPIYVFTDYGSPLPYTFVGGPPWFVVHLLWCNVFYAFVPGSLPAVQMPSVGACMGLGFIVGLFQAALPWSDAGFMATPGGAHSYLTYVVAFYVGCVARRNEWLAEVAEYPPATYWFLRFWVVLLGLFFFFWKKAVYEDPRENSGYQQDMDVMYGVFSMAMMLAQLQLFAQYANTNDGFLARWFVNASYTVYIIHPWFVSLFTWTFVLILKQRGKDFYDTWDQLVDLPIMAFDGTKFGWYSVVGFIYTATCAIVGSFVAGAAIRRIPYFDRVL